MGAVKLLLMVGLILISGCASTSLRESEQVCNQEAGYSCDVYEFAVASESALRTHGNAVTLDCPWHFYSPPPEEIRPECVALVEAALVLVNSRLHGQMESIDSSNVRYESSGGCADTFISGQEAADCFTVIRATIPIRWIESQASKQ
jgi:uncharacterized protein YceK